MTPPSFEWKAVSPDIHHSSWGEHNELAFLNPYLDKASEGPGGRVVLFLFLRFPLSGTQAHPLIVDGTISLTNKSTMLFHAGSPHMHNDP